MSGQALALRDILPGDWLWVGANAPAEPNCTPQALQTLLGREFRHAVFDAGQGFDAAAFAALSGTLACRQLAGFSDPTLAFCTRIRTWIHYAGAIVLSPFPHRHFVEHVKRVISLDRQALHWQQHQPVSCPHFLLARNRRTLTRTGDDIKSFAGYASRCGCGDGRTGSANPLWQGNS